MHCRSKSVCVLCMSDNFKRIQFPWKKKKFQNRDTFEIKIANKKKIKSQSHDNIN